MTASSNITRQWATEVQSVARINASLANIGTRFTNGSLGLTEGATELRVLDQQAAAVNQSLQALPPLPGADNATLTEYRQSVQRWSNAVHSLDSAVAEENILAAPNLASQLESIASNVDQQGQRLPLPAST